MPPLSHPLRSALVIILALLLSLAALFATLSLRKWMSAREPEPQQRSGITEVERQHLIESTSATSGAKQDEKETQKQRDAVTAKVPNNPLSKEEQQRLIQAASAP